MHLVYHLDSPPANLDEFSDASAKSTGDKTRSGSSARSDPGRPTTRRFVFRVLAIIGLAFLGVAAAFLAADWIFTVRAAPSSGRVVRLVVGRGTRPVVAYRVGRETYEIAARVGTSPPAYAVDEVVPVLYLPSQPQRAKIDTFMERHLFPTIFGGIGAVLFSVGAAGAFWQRQREMRLDHQVLFGEIRNPVGERH
jgi:hypothetical protein